MSDQTPETPKPEFLRLDVGDGHNGLNDLVGHAMNEMFSGVAVAILKSVVGACALGYNDGASGKPALVPNMVIRRDDTN